MKKQCSGISARNIHIKNLANIAKNTFSLKFIYILFMLIGAQLIYADNLSIEFIYGDLSIESVFFDHTTDRDYQTAAGDGKLSVKTSDSKQTPYTVTVTTDINKHGSTTIAALFNESLGYTSSNNDTSHMLELKGAYNSYAVDVDFRVGGTLYINGEPITSKFYLSHNNKATTGSIDWWIGTLNSSKAGVNTAYLLVSTQSGKKYCLNQTNEDYRIIVSSPLSDGSCDGEEGQLTQLAFKWSGMSSIKNVIFTYSGVHDAMYNGHDDLQSVDSSPVNSTKSVVKVYSELWGSPDIAKSFLKLMPGNAYTSGLGRDLEELDYYIEGTLQIIDNNSAKGLTVEKFTIGLQYDFSSRYPQVFWIGSSTNGYVPQAFLDKGGVLVVHASDKNAYCLEFVGVNTLKVSHADANYSTTWGCS